MKTSFFIKLVLLLLPLLVLAGDWLTSKSTKSIGGGGYDLSGLYYLVFSIGYFMAGSSHSPGGERLGTEFYKGSTLSFGYLTL